MDYVHPFTAAVYKNIDRITVRVSLAGKEGIFTWDGRWLSGDLRQADPNMCIYVAGGYRGGPVSQQ
jgi:hypothetical protein